MIRGRRSGKGKPVPHELPVLHVILDGIVVGLVGAGGGFLVVPALALLGGLPMPVAVGTSLVVIAMKSFAGLAGYLASVHINWGLAAAVTVAAIIGSFAGVRLAGVRLAGRIPADVIAVAVTVLWQEEAGRPERARPPGTARSPVPPLSSATTGGARQVRVPLAAY